jgi:putative ABC transport system substrate-binding protein
MAPRKSRSRRNSGKQKIIGFLGATNPKVWRTFFGTFEKRLRQLGWVDGKNIAVEQQWAEGDAKLHPVFATGFAARKVDVIVTSGTHAARAAKKAAKTIPIVFASAGDPVGTKLVKSLKRPGGNVTGLSNGQTDLARRRLDELRKVVPDLQRLAMLGNYGTRVIPLEVDQLRKRARRLGIDTVICDVRKSAQIGPAIKSLRGKVDALYVCTDPFITMHMDAINKAAASAKLPTMHAFREYVEAGGLMSYGPDFRAMFGRAADLVDRILCGEKPASIPVKVQKKHELVINKQMAHELGLAIPKGVRSRATIV